MILLMMRWMSCCIGLNGIFFLVSQVSYGAWSQALTWNSHHVDERIASTMSLIMEADELLRLVKGIAGRARELAAQWAERRFFERRDGQVKTHPASL